MTTLECMQKAVDYIEENLKCELSLAEIAGIAGFSTFHFSRIFCEYTGMTLMAFITKRRLYHAIWDSRSNGKLVDTALLHGFETHAGFFKAFRREFGCSPSKYLKLNSGTKPKKVNLHREARIMLTQTQIKDWLAQWDIDAKAVIGNTMGAGGAIKAAGTWTIGDRYIFKTGPDIAGLRTHLAISRILEENGMNAATPVKTRTGEDFLVEGDRYYVLTNKVPGEFLSPEQRYVGDRYKMGKKYGVAIGGLHKALQQETDLEINDSNLLETVIHWALPETKKIMEQWDYPLPEEFYREYEENFGKLYPLLPRQLIHRDANPSNIMFSGGEVSGFIDFIISERNVRLFDPCYCATGILSEAEQVEDGFGKWPELLRGILSGYHEVCSLTDSEQKAIPFIIYSIQMIFIAYLAQLEQEPYRNVALRNRKMLLRIWENRETCFPAFNF